jgi:hypothetical protein
MFTVISMPVPALPSKEFFSQLTESVERALGMERLSPAQAGKLCEYLDCLAANVPSLDKSLAAQAGARLRLYLERQLDRPQACLLAKRSPAARAAVSRIDYSCENVVLRAVA